MKKIPSTIGTGLTLALIFGSRIAFAAGENALPALAGIPIDFILFALTLLGVALFHRYTLQVAFTGAVTIALYKIVFTRFASGPSISGFLAHLKHE